MNVALKTTVGDLTRALNSIDLTPSLDARARKIGEDIAQRLEAQGATVRMDIMSRREKTELHLQGEFSTPNELADAADEFLAEERTL